MLGFSSNLERFAVCAVYCPLKLPQGPPLGTVAPLDGKPEAILVLRSGPFTLDNDYCPYTQKYLNSTILKLTLNAIALKITS